MIFITLTATQAVIIGIVELILVIFAIRGIAPVKRVKKEKIGESALHWSSFSMLI